MSEPRILLLDIECTNLDADYGYTMCVGYQWYGEKKIHVPSVLDYSDAFGKDPTNDKHLMRDIHTVMSQADMWVTFYGKMFDVPYLVARMLHHKLPILPPVPHTDLYFTARSNLKVSSRRLGNLIDHLGLNAKKTRLSGPIWVRAAAGHAASLRYIKTHCYHDINALSELYTLLRPLVRQHPNLVGVFKPKSKGKCRTCGSDRIQWRGTQLSRTNRRLRVHCQNCGTWDTRLAT